MSPIPDLTPSQFLAYHARLGLDSNSSYSLQELLTANTRSIPFESHSLHYSSSPEVKITFPDIFQKIILNNRDRGGYCMENNTLFLALLKSRGFDVWPAGARVSYEVDTQGKDKSGRFLGWNHMVIVVDDDKLVDVGFGGNGPISPIPLVEGEITKGVGPQEYRLLKKPIPGMMNQRLKYWVLQMRETQEKGWSQMYTFSAAVEFTPEDYEVMNLSTSTLSIFAGLVCCVRSILGEELPELGKDPKETVGKMLLNGDTVKRRILGKTEVLRVCKSEEERVDALKKWFGLELTEEERRGINGRATEIKMN